MLEYLKVWAKQIERIFKRNEQENTSFNLIEAQHDLSNQFNSSLPSQDDTVQTNKSNSIIQVEENLRKENLYIGLSSTNVLSKVKYLNMLLGQELFDEEFFQVKRGLLSISYNKKIIVNGHQCKTIMETKNYLKTFRTATDVIHLEFPVKLFEMLSMESKERIFFIDNFIEIKQDLRQLNFKYILLEKNIDLQLNLWMSTEKFYSEYGISMNTVTGEMRFERNQVFNLVSVIISDETSLTEPQPTKFINNLSSLKNKDKRKTLVNISKVQNIENQKLANKNKKVLKKRKNYSKFFQKGCSELDTSELSLNQGELDSTMPVVNSLIKNYCQCDPPAQLWNYNNEFQNYDCLINKGQQQLKNENQLNLMIAEKEVFSESDILQQKACVEEILKLACVHYK